MLLDAHARTDLVAFLRTHGYTGTDEAVWATAQRLSFEAQLRVYRSLQVNALRHESPAAAAFVETVLDRAPSHFDTARPQDLVWGQGLSLDRSDDRRRDARCAWAGSGWTSSTSIARSGSAASRT